MSDPIVSNADAVARKSTVPTSYVVAVRGFGNQERAAQFGKLLGVYVQELSSEFDLSQLDGVTVAHDYSQALLELDRGYSSPHRLTPSDTHVVGVAMTPSVLREGALKSHIVLNADYMLALENPDDETFDLALHILAHECAHVEVTHRFNTAFPGVLLQMAHPNLQDALRWQIIMACWDEYAATSRSAPYGRDQSGGYENTFLHSLHGTPQQVKDLIAAYRTHGDHARILCEVYSAYGNLMKFAAYHLGNLTGRGLSLIDFPRTNEALVEHSFVTYFERMHAGLKDIANSYGRWPDQISFERIGDLADELVARAGVHVTRKLDGTLNVRIP